MLTRIESYRALAHTYQDENDKVRVQLDDIRANIAALEKQLRDARHLEQQKSRELLRGVDELQTVRSLIRKIEDDEIAAEQERQAAERAERRAQEDFSDAV